MCLMSYSWGEQHELEAAASAIQVLTSVGKVLTLIWKFQLDYK